MCGNGIGYPARVSVMETILIFAVIPGAFCAIVGLLTMRSKLSGRTRYRPGQDWNYPPMWWGAHPDVLPPVPEDAGESTEPGRMTLGGARGSW